MAVTAVPPGQPPIGPDISQINTFVTDLTLPARLAKICETRGIQVVEAMPGYLETDDFQLAQKRMRDEPVNARWQSEMKDFFVETSGRDPDQLMSPIDEVFHID